MVPIVDIPVWQIHDWDSFHDVFATTLGFPAFFGRNLDALIDCLTYRDEDDGMASITVESGDVLTLHFGDASAFALRCPDQYAGLEQAAAFVNWRRIESGSRPIIALSFD